jgi:2-polyprenyl-6-methoxyphenol hydroxylase-like FAD-dependent oxidoreductase
VTNSKIGQRAIVIGAGISGLTSACALADYFEEVMIFERDPLPVGAEPRPGVPQGKHPQGLLLGGIHALRDLIPSIESDLTRSGCVSVNFWRDILFEVPGPAPFPRTDLGLGNSYAASRPMFEFILRQSTLQRSNITLVEQTSVMEILARISHRQNRRVGKRRKSEARSVAVKITT